MTRGWRGAGALCFALALGAQGCTTAPPPAGPSPEALAAHLSGMIWPLPVRAPGEITSPYGFRGRRHHDGLDIDGRTGDPVFAARDGRVVSSGWRRGYGLTVVLDHGGGITTLYGHNSHLLVPAGSQVQRGQQIARVGATGDARGDHLHFEVAWAGVALDPLPLLPRVAAR